VTDSKQAKFESDNGDILIKYFLKLSTTEERKKFVEVLTSKFQEKMPILRLDIFSYILAII